MVLHDIAWKKVYGTISIFPAMHHWTTWHYVDVIMGAMTSQITSLKSVYSTVYSGTDQSNIKSLCHWLCVGNSPVNSPHKWSVTRQMFPFDDVITDECDRLMCNRQNKAWKPFRILCFTAFYYTVINAEHAIYNISNSDELINMMSDEKLISSDH